MANPPTKVEWLKSIQTLLTSVDYDYIQSCSISVVPESLKKLNEDAYMPRVVSIGPRFKGSRDDLLLMEEVKLRCMLSLLHRGADVASVSLEKCSEAVWELDEEVRASYVTHIELQQHELGKIMLLDGCFLLELLISKGLDSQFPSRLWPPGPATEVLKEHDVLSDLMLLENQIPIMVLHKLSQTLFPNVFEPDRIETEEEKKERIEREHRIETEEEKKERIERERRIEREEQRKRELRAKKINNLALSVLGYYPLQSPCLEAPHILDLVHFFVNGTGERRMDNLVLGITDTTAIEKLKLNRCALSLQAAGVSIKVLEDRDKGISCFGLMRNCFGGVIVRIGNFIKKTKHRNATVSQVKGLDFHFKFDNGKLKIEQLHITETTKAKWRNVIVWEHHKKKGKSSSISVAIEDHGLNSPNGKFTLSALIFNGLICCSADLNFLKEKNIIVDHTNMSNEKLKEFFRTIVSGIDSGILDSSYVKLVDDLNNYSGAFFIIRILKILWHESTYCLEWLIKFLKQNYNFVAALLAILSIVKTVLAVLAYILNK
ncbi:hypothetical protein MtrunA17_Chr7g0242151 [Medicago truncatula]|uniref:DUF247 domain protein n=1 Tax=Medicago truncatula TaxID=3880 RepID=G7KRF2_MEDTR|nr:DUF247 domain protein [Medicago truncatula]RHN46434.1 hypothetical protein MtrunA17_Chr7g0242151 [Medicago truncatula]